MQNSTDQPRAVRAGEEINLQNLNDYLLTHAGFSAPVTEVKQFPGGFSNLTYCLISGNNTFVLRRPPFGANIQSAHDMGREFRVLSTLKNHYSKIPQPIIFCEDESVLGAPFYVMERLQGVILRASNATKMHLTIDDMLTASKALVENLVKLHAIDIQQSGLMKLGKPEGYVLRQVEGWIKRYYVAETDKIESLDEIAKWLQNNMPFEQKPSILHNDYKYDNVVFSEGNYAEIVGVLDWEMSTVGDPLMDLGATLAYWSEPSDSDEVKFFNLTWMPGNLSRNQVVETYAQQSGRDVSNVLFYYTFGMFKNAVIAQQIYARWKQGFSKDDRFGMLLPVIKGLGKQAAASLNKGSF